MTPFTVPVVSVVLPARDEAESIAALLHGVATAMSDLPHEIVVVDDGSHDGTDAAALASGVAGLRVIRHQRGCGQSAAIRTGVMAARGRLVATLDADGQNPPSELPRLLAPLLASDADPRLGLVQGQRAMRRDGWAKRVGSRVANTIRSAILGDGVRDSGCGLKAFPRDVYLGLAYFDHIHRFMPAMVRREGLRVMVLEVAHAPRRAGRSKYGNLGRTLVGIADLAGVAWLARRKVLPLVSEVETSSRLQMPGLLGPSSGHDVEIPPAVLGPREQAVEEVGLQVHPAQEA